MEDHRAWTQAVTGRVEACQDRAHKLLSLWGQGAESRPCPVHFEPRLVFWPSRLCFRRTSWDLGALPYF